ncbi:MAG: hypothetical protein AB8I08_28200 [Sandaracinaceae bacterium]
MNLSKWLETRGAHHDVVSWATPFGDDHEALYKTCPRGDWLLGIAARAGIPARQRVAAARDCVALALDQVPDDAADVHAALATLDRWLAGEDDRPRRDADRAACEAAADRAADPAAQAGALAIRAALGAVDEPDDAAAAVAFVVQAAMLDVGECAVMSAVRYAQSSCADHVRAHISFGDLDAALNRDSE